MEDAPGSFGGSKISLQIHNKPIGALKDAPLMLMDAQENGVAEEMGVADEDGGSTGSQRALSMAGDLPPCKHVQIQKCYGLLWILSIDSNGVMN